MKRNYFLAGIAVMFLAMCLLGAQSRNQNETARDTSLVPSADSALTELTISDDADHTVTLSSLAFTPLILQVRADGNFHQGSALPVQANDIYFDAGQIWSIPVSGNTTWHFMRQSGAGTVHIWIKALGSN